MENNKQYKLLFRPALLSLSVMLLCFMSCSPQVRFTNNHNRSFANIFREQFAEDYSNVSGLGVLEAKLVIRLDGEKFNVSTLAAGENSAYRKIDSGSYHDFQVDFDLQATNATGIVPVSLAYIAEWEMVLDELYEDLEDNDFSKNEKYTVELDLQLLENGY